MKRFALIGAAGFIAPRHLKAIKDTGNELIAALDPHDSVGILDSHFPNARFFTEFERFDRHIDKLRRKGEALDYVSIASPNYLHDAHIRFALRSGADAICEKPMVINPWNLDGLAALEKDSGRRVFTILQLRLHPSVIGLKKQVEAAISADPGHSFDVQLDYVTSRGAWYFSSWKGQDSRSGGIVTNIGIHFFDMLLWIFGEALESSVEALTDDRASGSISFSNASVRWFLSVNSDDLPDAAKARNQRTYRSIRMDGAEVEFSEGFTDLHTASYRDILAGGGFGIDDARPSISLVHDIRAEAGRAGGNP
jgi:UDP-N-acetyl-2-amino-2-deoxyglucuronate dehydrogenase